MEFQNTRREFIRQASCAALGLSGLVGPMSMLQLANAAVIQGNLAGNLATKDDYKALVCIFLAGGNDAHNMIVPMGNVTDNPIRADYENVRGIIALPSDELHPLNVPSDTKAFQRHYNSGASPMGVHPSAQSLATLFNDGELGIVCNVGTLVQPILTREQYFNQTVEAPSRLFAHNTQTMQWQTSAPDDPKKTGWGGRLADLLHAGYNGDASKASMSMAIGGTNIFQRGTLQETSAFVPSVTGVSPLHGFGEIGYEHAVEAGSTFIDPIYKNSVEGQRLQALEKLIQLSNANLLQNELGKTLVTSRHLDDTVGGTMDVANESGVDFDGIFTAANADTGLGEQLKLIAQFIAGRSALGNQRQIFYAVDPGYDNHSNILVVHARQMEELSNALLAFRNALVALGDWDKTVAFTASDFARTLAPNTSGTDHGWGSHAMMMGGPIQGGDLYGHYPPLKIGDAPESLDALERGLLIPTTSVDQYSAPLAQWFGADANSMETIFPNLYRFDDPFSSATANMQFLNG